MSLPSDSVKEKILKTEPNETRSQSKYAEVSYFALLDKNTPTEIKPGPGPSTSATDSVPSTSTSPPSACSSESESPGYTSPPGPASEKFDNSLIKKFAGIGLVDDGADSEDEDSDNTEISDSELDGMAAVGDTKSPPVFTGASGECPLDWLRQFDKYCEFKELAEAKKLQLFKYLLQSGASDWMDGLPTAVTGSYGQLVGAFKERYGSSTAMKYRIAKELFGRKQGALETVDEFVTAVKKLGREIQADMATVQYTVVNGLRPDIAAHVARQQPTTLEEVVAAARVAEAVPLSDGHNDQLVELQMEVKRMAAKLDRTMIAPVQPRSTPASYDRRSPSPRPFGGRHVTFGRPPTTYGRQQQQQRRQQQQPPQQQRNCTRCGRTHKNNYCPAQDSSKRCHYCSRPGHFVSQCFAAKRDQQWQGPRY